MRLTRERLDLGREGETLALERLQSLGYRCIARNYRCALGEVDLIAEDGETLVFVEIKTRGRSLEYAKSAVTERKKRQLSKVALAYMKANNCCNVKSRFDVVAVRVKGGAKEIEVVKNAFDLAY
ncbi:MAG: YraN family protein [Desulfobacteraceae bacterium]|nr:MAG: YraN family protein [Desulfobacteraceae bacterium]